MSISIGLLVVNIWIMIERVCKYWPWSWSNIWTHHDRTMGTSWTITVFLMGHMEHTWEHAPINLIVNWPWCEQPPLFCSSNPFFGIYTICISSIGFFSVFIAWISLWPWSFLVCIPVQTKPFAKKCGILVRFHGSKDLEVWGNKLRNSPLLRRRDSPHNWW